MTTGNKYHKDKFFTKIEHDAVSGVVGQDQYEVWGEIILKVITTFATSGTLTVQGRIHHSTTWEDIGTMTFGGDSDAFNISTYDYIRFNFTTQAGSSGEISASGFFKGSAGADSGAGFGIFQPDFGSSPSADIANNILTLTSSDSSVIITGDSSKDTINLQVSPSGGGLLDTFETVSKNLRVYDYVLNYTGGQLTSIVYTIPAIGTITKTLNYTGDQLTSIVLSGNTPGSIDLTKTLSYTGDQLTGVIYS
jgi:hypothetical protein